jgi:hypothetical protein
MWNSFKGTAGIERNNDIYCTHKKSNYFLNKIQGLRVTMVERVNNHKPIQPVGVSVMQVLRFGGSLDQFHFEPLAETCIMTN